jgi:aromatic-amino-acid transaminase
MFAHVEPYAADSTLCETEKFATDPRLNKVHLEVGIYYDEEGKIPVLQSVRTVAAKVFEANGATSYLPIEGDRNY